MELIQEAREGQAKTRAEFNATLNVALALARQLKMKLMQWGERMEADRSKDSV